MDWKEQPHLFANGKYKVNCGNLKHKQINAYFPASDSYVISNMTGQDVLRPIISCTLIARPIEDITEEEYVEMYPHRARASYCKDALTALIRRADMGKLQFSEVEKLMSFGMYFGTQSHFEDGTVIDSRTLE